MMGFDSIGLWGWAALGVGGVVLLCVQGAVWGWQQARRCGVDPALLQKAVRESAAASVLPGLGSVLGVAVMAGYLGTPLAWLRFCLAGGLPYELTAATLTAGQGLARLTPTAYAGVALITTLGMLAGPLLCLTVLPWYVRVEKRQWAGWLTLAAATALAVLSALAMGRELILSKPYYSVNLSNTTDAAALQKSLCGVALLYWPGALVEFLVCAPLLGRAGSTVSFLAGNLSNLRLPCVLEAHARTGTRHGTPAGEGVGAVAVAASTAVTLGITTAGSVCIAPFAESLGRLLRPFTGAVQVAVFVLYALPVVRCGVNFVKRYRAARHPA